MEQKISEDRILLAGKLSQSQHAFQISAGSSLVDLHNEHDEGFKRQLRKVTKSKTGFRTDGSLLKMLYLAMMDATENGQADVWMGVLSMHSLPFITRIACLNNRTALTVEGV